MSKDGIPFVKLEALGNAYIVVNPKDKPHWEKDEVVEWCSEEWGIGSDGILWGPFYDSPIDPPRLEIFNSDGTQAEKSGNGLRIFSRYLWDEGFVTTSPFTIFTPSGPVESKVFDDSKIEIHMGKATFIGEPKEKLSVQCDEHSTESMRDFDVSRVSIGNPHCCVFSGFDTVHDVKKWGKFFEHHSRFPHKTNVQFAKIVSKSEIFFEVWERGSGYTLASGSSACAVAFAAFSRGLVGSKLNMKMPGGEIDIEISNDGEILMTGPATWICRGTWLKPVFEKPGVDEKEEIENE